MNKVEQFISEYWNTLKFVTIVVTLIGILFSFDTYLDSKIENKITNNNYIESLSESLRPFCVFNESGIIIYDHGAEKYINQISLSSENGKNITIEFNHFFQNTPLLMTVGAKQYSYEADKTNNRIFVYKLSSHSTVTMTGANRRKVADNRYILEILK